MTERTASRGASNCERMALIGALMACAVSTAAAEAPRLRVHRAAGAVEIDNGLVKARFTRDRDGVRQEYLAARGAEWVPLAEGFRPRSRAAGERAVLPTPSLYDTAVDPAHRLLAAESLRDIGAVTETDHAVSVALAGESGGARIEQTVAIGRGRRVVHLEVAATLGGSPPRLEYLLAPLQVAFDGRPDATHAPSYKPTPDSIVGDRVFFAPVACVQQGGLFVGLVPDLDAIDRHVVFAKGARQHPDSNSFPVPVDPATVSMPTALDLELPADGSGRAVLAYGLIDALVRQHVWFQHVATPGAMVRELSDRDVRIGMDLILSAEAPACQGYRMASRHLWERYGSRHFLAPRPQAMPCVEYARLCYPAQFRYQGYDVAGERLRHRQLPDRPDLEGWQQWDEAGRPVGGLRLHAPQWSHLVANLAWWNNVCDATGLYHWSSQLDPRDPLAADLRDKARRMVNLALAAPQDQGLFPALYDLAGRRWLRGLWNPPLEGYDPAAARAYWDWTSGNAAYQTAAASVTAGYLMQYRRTCEDDPRILPYVRRYGDFLLARMQPDGCVPAWFTADLEPLPSLKWNADGGAHAWVLGELYLATREPKYLAAAERLAAFLEEQVLPRQRWADFEAFYSCAIKPETFVDARTGQWPCNDMCLSWALQGWLTLHEATRDGRHLAAAEAAADFATLFQAVWAPHYVITAYPFGGISSQLGDAEWLDQRAHRFAEPFVRIGLLTRRQDLVERGVAAARSSLTLVNHPRHAANAIYSHTDFPVGLGPENIDHEGFPQRPLSSGPSWGSVGGLAGMAHVLRQLGGVHVDLERGIAVGVDGLAVRGARLAGRVLRLEVTNQLAALTLPYVEAYAVELRVTGLPDEGQFDLVINGGAPVTLSAAELAALRLTVTADRVAVMRAPLGQTGPE